MVKLVLLVLSALYLAGCASQKVTVRCDVSSSGAGNAVRLDCRPAAGSPAAEGEIDVEVPESVLRNGRPREFSMYAPSLN